MSEPRKPYVSPSQLDMYLRCGEQYRRRYILGEKIPPGVAMVKGKAVHKGAEVNLRQKIESHADLPESDVVDAAAAEVETSVDSQGLMLTEEEQGRGLGAVVGELKDRSVLLARTMHRQLSPRLQPVMVERPVRIDLPDASHDLFGIVDVVDQQGVVRDLKVSGRKKPQAEVDRSDQLTFYALAIEKETGQPVPAVAFDEVVDRKTPGVETTLSTRGPADAAVFVARVNAMLGGVKAGVFAPAPVGSWVCSPRFCGYWQTCPYVNSARRDAAEKGETP